MLDAQSRQVRNHLLAGLTGAQRALLLPHLEPVDLRQRDVLEQPGEPIAHVHFPDAGLLSVIAVGSKGERVEVAAVGRDGMTGLAGLVGDDRSPYEAIVQLDGFGHRIAAGALRAIAQADEGVRERLLRYGQAFAVQAAFTALSNAPHPIEHRLARWLLICQDRTGMDALPLTHEFLSLMLGVRRAGVTVAIHELEGRGLIRATRGHVRVLSREGLIEAAQGSYGLAEAEYVRLLGGRRGAGEG